MATAPEATKMREMAMPVKIGKLVVDIDKLLTSDEMALVEHAGDGA